MASNEEVKMYTFRTQTQPPLWAKAALFGYFCFIMLPLSIVSYLVGALKILTGRWKPIPLGLLVPPKHENKSRRYGKLVTISISHFCLKSKWALRRSNIPFVEEKHAPLFHISSLWYSGGRNRGTPLYIEKTGTVVWDSTGISHYLHKSCGQTWLFPDDSVIELDKYLDRLGAATRQLAYRYVCNDMYYEGREVIFRQSAPWEKTLGRFTFPVLHALLATFLGINSERATAKALRTVQEVFDKTDNLLKDGRKFIANTKELSAADITLCSLAYPIIFPPQLSDISIGVDDPRVGESWKVFVGHWRGRPTGQYVLRIFDTEFK